MSSILIQNQSNDNYFRRILKYKWLYFWDSLITYTVLYWQLVKVFRGFMEQQLNFRIVYLLAVNSVII